MNSRDGAEPDGCVRTLVSHFPSGQPPVRVFHVGHERATYAPFRSTFFFDPVVNPLLRGEGGDPDRLAAARESRRLWTANAPTIATRSAKTDTCPGSAFKNQALSADRLYSTSRNTMGYDVHRSMRGSSLCDTTKRFPLKTTTPESVGPGSYNLQAPRTALLRAQPRAPSCPNSTTSPSTDRLREWGNRSTDCRAMDSADEWKTTSEKPSPTAHSFQRARQMSWIEQVEERQRRSAPASLVANPSTATSAYSPARIRNSRPEGRMPDFVQGIRSPITSKQRLSAREAIVNVSPRTYTTIAAEQRAGNESAEIAPPFNKNAGSDED